MIINAASPESILEKLKDDPYVQENIWNMKEAEFIPFKTHFRDPDSSSEVAEISVSTK